MNEHDGETLLVPVSPSDRNRVYEALQHLAIRARRGKDDISATELYCVVTSAEYDPINPTLEQIEGGHNLSCQMAAVIETDGIDISDALALFRRTQAYRQANNAF